MNIVTTRAHGQRCRGTWRPDRPCRCATTLRVAGMLPWLRTRCRRRRRWCQCLGILILVHHHRLHERARKCRQNFGCLGLKLCLFFDLRTSPYEYYRYARIEIQIKIRNTTLTIAATSFLLGVSSLYTMALALRSPCSTLFVPRQLRICAWYLVRTLLQI